MGPFRRSRSYDPKSPVPPKIKEKLDPLEENQILDQTTRQLGQALATSRIFLAKLKTAAQGEASKCERLA